MIQVIAVGKKHEGWVSEGIARYEKRLKQPFLTEWILLPHSSREGNDARREESRRLLERLKADDFVILLDEAGDIFDSPRFSQVLRTPLERSQKVTIIIGGAYGVDQTIHQRADVVWSLSRLVFPHQLVRLILAEQLYRAQEIAGARPYHHE
jgi:23S rRNA (pseudouridine1915-N3)-methyltransferase